MTGRDDEELRELVALAAVGALDAVERTELQEVLAMRADLRKELDELEAAAAVLGDAVIEAPPPSLRAGVLAAIRDVPQERAAAPVVPISAARRHRARPRRWSVVAGLAAAAAAVIGVVVVTNSGDDGVQVADVVAADDAVTTSLTGQLDGLQLVRSDDHGALALVGNDLPAPSGDRVYELWVVTDEPQRVDIFRPDSDGRVALLVADLAAPNDAVFAVTEEPAGGSDAPTGDILAASA